MTKVEAVLQGRGNSKNKGKCYDKDSKKLTNQTKTIEQGKISLSSPYFLGFYFRKK